MQTNHLVLTTYKIISDLKFVIKKDPNMQIARISMGEYKSKDALDEFIDDYSKDFWELFPSATSASTVRTGTTSIINTTIYPDEDSAKEGLEKRMKFLKGYSHMIADTFFYEGDVAFATHEKNKAVNTSVDSKNHVSEQIRLESLEREVRELKSMMRQLLEATKC